MNEWLLSAAILTAAILPCLAVCALAEAAHALVAVEVAGTLATSVLMLLSEGFHRQPFIDLALAAALLSTLGALAMARLMEHGI
jgi:multisubunit Na+/H+ antiporter MnhF subunit